MKTLNGKNLYARELNCNTARAQEFIYNYNHAKNSQNRKYFSVQNFYINPSQSKIKSEICIKENIKLCEGFGYYVTGGNSSCYSAGWLVCDSNHQLKLIYETKANRYSIDYNYSVVIE